MGDTGFSFQQCFVFVSEFLEVAYFLHFFPPIKACATRALSKNSHACKKENPEIKQC